MATPIGHVLGGYLVYACASSARPVRNRIVIWVCLALAISPDLDFVPGLWVGQPALYH